MQKFKVGDTVRFTDDENRISMYSYLCGYNHPLKDKVGLVYRYFAHDNDRLYVFFPELPGQGIRQEWQEPMIELCYDLYEEDLKLEP